MAHTYNQSVVHHVEAIENILEPWRWDREQLDGDDNNNHVLILNAKNPVTINLHRSPESFERGDTINVIISRGTAVSLTYNYSNELLKTVTLDNDIPYTIRYRSNYRHYEINKLSSYAENIGVVFNLTKLDLEPILFPLGLSNSHPSLAGRLSFQCDWEGSKTLSLWRDNVHKVFKFYNVKSGHHCLDYSIPRSLVAAWTSSGKTRMMPLDLRIEDSGVEQMVWTGATKLDVPDLSFLRDSSESE